jgi:hypothetical protein
VDESISLKNNPREENRYCIVVATSGREEDIGKGVGGLIRWKYNELMYDNGTLRCVKTILEMRKEE